MSCRLSMMSRKPSLLTAGVISVCLLALAGCATVSWGTAHKEGSKASGRGFYSDAETHYLAALKAIESEPPDRRLALTLNNLALSYRRQRRYAEAEPLYKRALAVWEKLHGPEHQGVATTLGNLGMLYRDQRKYVEAEPLLKRSLAIREKALPPHHGELGISFNNLAILYFDQGRLLTLNRSISGRWRSWRRLMGPESACNHNSRQSRDS